MPDAGFKLQGRDDYSDVLLEHSSWPGARWRLMIPEYGWVGKARRSRKVEWPVRSGSSVSWRWDDGEASRAAGNGFWGEAMVVNSEEVEYTLTFRNLGPGTWSERQSSLICLISGDVPAFHDYGGHRTFVYECESGGFIDADSLIGGDWPDHRMCGARTPGNALAGEPAVESLMAKVSEDGTSILAIATDPSIGVSCNHQESMSCIHSNPLWGALPPGEESTVRGKIYLFEGTLDEALARYERDFGMLCRPR
jgi:hypothetical protein